MGHTSSVDLNADVGEAIDGEGLATERELLALVTSVNVACGGHAGDEHTMRDTVAAALDHGVRVGAHPSYPDRAGFGRRPMVLAPADLEASLCQQLRALIEIGSSLDVSIDRVKPHGALYGDVARGGAALDALLAALHRCGAPGAALVLPAGSAALERCRRDHVAARAEGFLDRAYAPDGSLVDRGQEGAVLSDPAQAAAQAVDLARGGTVDTLCIHADSPGAVSLASAVRRALGAAGIRVSAGPS